MTNRRLPQADETLAGWRTSASGAASPEVVDDRYLLLDELGRGATSVVYRARDRHSGAVVALKRITLLTEQSTARVAREVEALRLLDLPGVVRLLGVGHHGGTPYVVMAEVEGAPFPGEGRRDWPSIRGPLGSLLATLEQLHGRGLVHRDIKPANVLVDDDGAAVLLDFGLVRGAPVGATITHRGLVVGTPRYLAPELLVGASPDARSDLYSVAAMVYEALAGQCPHAGDDLPALWRAKLSVDPTPLRQLCGDVPWAVAATLDSMLERHPDGRPDSAAAALAALGEDRGVQAMMPWVGPRDPLDRLVEAARSGRPMDIVGPVGSGRTRCLQEVAAAVEAAGARVAWATPAGAPLASLAAITGPLPPSADAPRVAQARLEAYLASGGVVLVDSAERLDRWSRDLLAGAPGAVLRAAEAPQAARPHARLHPWTEDHLRALFWGPDRVLHLREDGARALLERTDGLAAAVAAEVRSWLRAGVARWEQGRLRVTRAQLDRLSAGLRTRAPEAAVVEALDGLDPTLRELLGWVHLAGPAATVDRLSQVAERPRWQLELELQELCDQGLVRARPGGGLLPGVAERSLGWSAPRRQAAHARLAEVLPDGAAGRLDHMLEGRVTEGLAAEAARTARRLRHGGQVGRALAVLRRAMTVLVEAEEPAEALFPAMLRTALSAQDVAALERIGADLERAGAAPRVLALAQAARDALADAPARARSALDALPRFADRELEYARQVSRFHAAQADPSPEAAAALLAELHEWADATAEAELQARVLGWEGLVRYRQARFAEAAALHEQSAARRTQELGRLSARLNAATAWLDAGDLTRAEAVAAAALREAAAARAAGFEARAELALRSVRAARLEACGADLELVGAVEALGQSQLTATLLCIEVRLALLEGRPEQAAQLARRGVVHARALASGHLLGPYLEAYELAADPDAAVDGVALTRFALGCPVPMMGLEVLGVLAGAGRLSGDHRDAARRMYRLTPPCYHRVRRSILPFDEALRRVEAVAVAG